MTVNYALECANASIWCFARMIFRWRGSVYRLIYKEMLIFTILYYMLALLYRVGLSGAQRKFFLIYLDFTFKKISIQFRNFEDFAIYCRDFTDSIPLSFILGFYVTIVVNRFSDMLKLLPWIDRYNKNASRFQ